MNKKGFTLIEVLAVIVILSLLVVLIVPNVSKTLEESKIEIIKDNVYAYKKSVEKYVYQKMMNKEEIKLEGTYQIIDKKLIQDDEEHIIDISGKLPKNGTLIFINDELDSGCITIDRYKATIENGEIKEVTKGNCEI